jgi:hypothetical protein
MESGQSEMAVLVQSFGDISSDLEKAVNKESPSRTWPVHYDYDVVVDEMSGESFVVATLGLFELVQDEDVGHGQRVKTYRGREPEQAVLTDYDALRTPELAVELANLADNAITPEAVKGWAEVYGLLAPSSEPAILNAFPDITDFAYRESVSEFARAAGEVRTCLRTYGALQSDEDLDLEKLASEVGPLPGEAMRPQERKQGHERAWLFGVLGRMTQTRLHEHCYPQFNIYTRGLYPTGRFALSWGFHNLLGAIWIQIAWLLESQGSVRFCRLPDCRRVITFEPGEPSYEISKPGRGKYKTRSDRVFCHDRWCKQNYHNRKKRGWPGYV